MNKSIKSHLSNLPKNADLDKWLCYLESIHSTEIDMGLERIARVAKLLKIDVSASQVITVAGTNGKGTTCAFLENALRSKGRTVAVYSSPHFYRFNERLRINHQDVADDTFVRAFELIERTRGDTSLTYYEYTTLAALLIIEQQKPDVAILEVGLGGRLDATNIIDADISVITSIDLDHQSFLGDTREAIGLEKAGIMRANRYAVVGEPDLPANVKDYAKQLGAKLICREHDFIVTEHQQSWSWQSQAQKPSLTSFRALPYGNIPVANIATALMVLTLLDVNFSNDELSQLIHSTKLAGRTEIVAKAPDIVLDVGHNPHAARYLSQFISKHKSGKVHAVVAMLSDKDQHNTLAALTAQVDYWYVASLDVPRGAQASVLSQALTDIFVKSGERVNVNSFDNVGQAYRIAKQNSKADDLILVFGSFFTVAQVREHL
jgi:dihydrofolate synthase/folylpolyglutamate synthase